MFLNLFVQLNFISFFLNLKIAITLYVGMMQAITEVHDVGGYISSPAPLIKLQHSICCFLIYSFGDNIMQKIIGMSFFC